MAKFGDLTTNLMFSKFKALAKEIRFAFDTMPAKPKAFFGFLFVLFVGSLAFLIWQLNQKLMIAVPAEGGSLTEGVIGSARFVNPLLAVSDADRDLTSLIYSGLVRIDGKGNFIPDLAKSYEVSEDRLTYTFYLKDNLSFHDGKPLTAEDVKFTFEKAMDSAIKSSKRANWDGVTVEQLDSKTIRLTLKKSYPAFLENTTLGILPKHLWGQTSAETFPLHERNLEAVGSGPYLLSKINKDSDGLPVSYELEPFVDFALNKPRIKKITIRFYNNEESLISAYQKGEIDSLNSLPPGQVKTLETEGVRVVKSTLPRVFAVFFNQNHNAIFLDKNVRQALSLSIPRDEIVQNIFHGYAEALDGIYSVKNTDKINFDLEKAKEVLAKAGWNLNDQGVMEKIIKNSKNSKSTTKQILSFSLATSNIEELKQIANVLKKNWAAIGVKVEIEIYDPSDLNQNIIRPRKYDALLFGEVMGRDGNPYPFWHSSQRADPGLNIAMYTNAKVDTFLEEAKLLINQNERKDKYQAAEKEIKKDIPAAFIYSPYFLYLLPRNILGVSLPTLTNPSERFSNVYKWYVRQDKVWKIFENFYK